MNEATNQGANERTVGTNERMKEDDREKKNYFYDFVGSMGSFYGAEWFFDSLPMRGVHKHNKKEYNERKFVKNAFYCNTKSSEH